MFQVGDKVCIPKTKSIGKSLSTSPVVTYAKVAGLDYLCITGYAYGGEGYVLDTLNNFECGVTSGDYFLEQDLVLYNLEDYYIGGVKDVQNR